MRASILSGLFLVGLAACSAAPGEESAASSSEALSTTTDTFVTVRADMRKCASPMCGGYYVKDVNRATAEQYVSALDYAACDLGDDVQRTIAAGLSDVVLYGRLSKKDQGYRKFVVAAAWRGMPGVTVDDPAAAFYLDHKLNSTATCKAYDDVDVTAAAKSRVDSAWLTDQVTLHSGIVVGTIVVGTKNTRVLQAEQVFVKLPVDQVECPTLTSDACPESTVRAYTRDADLCLNDAGCVETKFCPMFLPACDDGYTLASWTSTSGCPTFACDPSFVR